MNRHHGAGRPLGQERRCELLRSLPVAGSACWLIDKAGPLGLDGLQDHLSAQAVRALCALTIVLLSHLLESLVSQLARFIRPALRALPEPQR